MKLESLVIAHQNGAVICSRALYTPPVTPPELGVPEVASLTVKRTVPKVCLVRGVKS